MPTGTPATTSIAAWQRATRHVETSLRSGDYINAETTLVFAGPPRASDVGSSVFSSGGGLATDELLGGNKGADALYPIGLVESFGLQQVQTVQKMYEIGSRRSYQAGGRVQVVGNLGRVLFNGPSLLRTVMAYYPNTIQLANGKRLDSNNEDSIAAALTRPDPSGFPEIYLEPGALSGARTGANDGKPPAFFINLMSELFSHPFGLGVLLRDNKNRNYGAFYLEDCMITSHSWSVSATSTLITEAANFQADAAIPMEFSTGAQGVSAGPQVRPLAG